MCASTRRYIYIYIFTCARMPAVSVDLFQSLSAVSLLCGDHGSLQLGDPVLRLVLLQHVDVEPPPVTPVFDGGDDQLYLVRVRIEICWDLTRIRVSVGADVSVRFFHLSPPPRCTHQRAQTSARSTGRAWV